MGALEKVNELKSQGRSDQEISQILIEQGIPPKEINNALSQSQVKSAVSQDNEQEMQPSLMQQQTQEMQQAPQPMQEEYYPPQMQVEQPGFQPEQAEQYPVYQDYQQPLETDIVSEIAEQVAAEKINEFEKRIGNLHEFRTITEAKIQNIDERLKRIENMIETLQATILGKIGSHIQNIKDIKTEMQSMQNTFSKILNPLTHNIRKLKTQTKTTKKK